MKYISDLKIKWILDLAHFDTLSLFFFEKQNIFWTIFIYFFTFHNWVSFGRVRVRIGGNSGNEKLGSPYVNLKQNVIMVSVFDSVKMSRSSKSSLFCVANRVLRHSGYIFLALWVRTHNWAFSEKINLSRVFIAYSERKQIWPINIISKCFL